jgi:hypothetical protein
LTGAAGVLQDLDSRLLLNRLFLSGVLIADPLRDEGRDGKTVTLLLVAFPAPDTTDTARAPEIASCEIEVPEEVAGSHTKAMRAGRSIFITGQVNGGGGIVAIEVHQDSQLTKPQPPSTN